MRVTRMASCGSASADTLEHSGETGTDDRSDSTGGHSLSYNENVLVPWAKLPTFMPEDPQLCGTPRVSVGQLT